jgi:hypothetical protein
MEPIQPWSAAGAENQIRIFSPDAGAEPAPADPVAEPPAAPVVAELFAAAVPAVEEVLLVELFDELVQAVSASAPTATMAIVCTTDRESCLPGRTFRVRDILVLLHCVVTENRFDRRVRGERYRVRGKLLRSGIQVSRRGTWRRPAAAAGPRRR